MASAHEYMQDGTTGITSYDNMPLAQREQYNIVQSQFSQYQFHANADRGHDFAAEQAARAAYNEAKAAYELVYGPFDRRIGEEARYAAYDLERAARRTKTAA